MSVFLCLSRNDSYSNIPEYVERTLWRFLCIRLGWNERKHIEKAMRKIEAAVCGITLLYVFSTIGTIYCLIMGSYLTLFLISDTVAVLCFMSYIAISLFIYLRTNHSFKDSRTLKICLIIMAVVLVSKYLGFMLIDT